MAILVSWLILTGDPDRYASGPAHFDEYQLELLANRIEKHIRPERKVQVFRESVVTKVAPLERRPSLESQPLSQRRPRKPDQKPRHAVVSLQDGLRYASPTALSKAVREQGKVALRDHSLCPDHGAKFIWLHIEPQVPSAGVSSLR